MNEGMNRLSATDSHVILGVVVHVDSEQQDVPQLETRCGVHDPADNRHII